MIANLVSGGFVGRLCTSKSVVRARRKVWRRNVIGFFHHFAPGRLCTSTRPGVAVVCARRRVRLCNMPLFLSTSSLSTSFSSTSHVPLYLLQHPHRPLHFFQQIYHPTHLLIQHYHFQHHQFSSSQHHHSQPCFPSLHLPQSFSDYHPFQHHRQHQHSSCDLPENYLSASILLNILILNIIVSNGISKGCPWWFPPNLKGRTPWK